MRYVVVYEQGPSNFSAYVPDLPGCVATGKTHQDVRRNIREAIIFHLEGYQRDGEQAPQPGEWTETMAIDPDELHPESLEPASDRSIRSSA